MDDSGIRAPQRAEALHDVPERVGVEVLRRAERAVILEAHQRRGRFGRGGRACEELAAERGLAVLVEKDGRENEECAPHREEEYL